MAEKITAKKSLELRSGEVQDIIGQPPHWLIRWGITVFFLLLVLILALSWFVKYPDIVEANFTLTSVNAPKPVNARIDGKLTRLLVKENVHVNKGQLLGFMESTADPAQVFSLSSVLDSLLQELNENRAELIPALLSNHYSHLGELQLDFQVFNQAFLKFRSYLASGYYTAKKQILSNDLKKLEQLNKSYVLQQTIAQSDLQLAQQSYNMQEALAAQKVIAAQSFREEESRLLSKKMPLEQINAYIINNERSQDAKQDELLELEKEISEQKVTFLQAVNTFKSQIEEWKYRYILTAPMSGTVNFISFLQENQSVQNGLELFYIMPGNSEYMGIMYVAQFNLGKIHRGQDVIIKFAGYPFEEYGSVRGKITDISNVPKGTDYLVKVMLANGLKTDYGKELQYREGMVATGEIITADKRLIDKFVYNFRKMTSVR